MKIDGQAVEPVIQCVPREDLVDLFGKSARHSGWKANVDLRDFEVSGGPLDIEAEAVDVDGGRHPLPASHPDLKVQVALHKKSR